jgi:hypothetical protein
MAAQADRPARRPSTARQVAALSEQVQHLTATVAALEQTLAGRHGTSAADAPNAGEDERYFPALDEFVNLWLLPTFRRPLAALGMGSWRWCPRWWDHPEAWLVFGALWDQWEHNRPEQLGMVEFTRDVLLMLPEVCGEHGPFAKCRGVATDDGYQPQRHLHVPVAPAAPAPPGWWDRWWADDTDTADQQPDPPLLFADVEEFVTTLFLPTFRRDPNAVGVTRWNWCDQWWAHDEVVHHMLNLWYLFEARAPEGRLIEFVRETYFLLPHLHSDAGPLRECTPSGKPGGATHHDLAIAPIQPRPATASGGHPEADWAGPLITALRRRRHAPAPEDRERRPTPALSP